MTALVLAAHGTRDPAGAACVEQLAAGVRAAAPGVAVRVAYADVRTPSVADVLAALSPEPAVVVPAFLASGYHVRVDLPAQIAASGHRGHLALAPAFGPAPELLAVLLERLRSAGYRPGDRVVFAAAGSSDPHALVDVHDAAYSLGVRLGGPVRVGYAATAMPTAASAVADVRAAAPGARVAVASWLLAPGFFHRRLSACGADVVAEPLGAHPRVVDLVLQRYAAALRSLAAA